MALFRRLSQVPEPLSDAALLEKYRNSHNQHYLGLLYTRYTDLVYGVCLKYLGSEEAAADAVIDIYEELFDKTLRHEVREFKGWLFTLTRNHCLMALRKASKNITQSFDPALMYSLVIPHLQDMEAVGAQEKRLQQLEDCIDKLPKTQKLCVRLFYLDEISYKDIAERQNLDLGIVRSHIQNGRRNLRHCMEAKQT